MPANVFRFEESWEIPNATVEEVYQVLARGELLARWWKGVYLEAHKLSDNPEPKVGDRLRVRARGFLPYELNFIVEAVELTPGKVAVKTIGDFEGLWSATLSPRGSGVHVDLVWQVTVVRPILKFLAPLLRPAFAWNHRWTTPRGEQAGSILLKGGRPPSFERSHRLIRHPAHPGLVVDAEFARFARGRRPDACTTPSRRLMPSCAPRRKS